MPLSLDDVLTVSSAPDMNLLMLDDALNSLSALDSRKGKIVELKFFGGLSMKEIAAVLKVSTDTVLRDWRISKSWLLREMSGENQLAT